ncbi:COX15/CtaA family protein [bacterium SCSIO 12696]|nr:COX15/CtaA family protein [bacterium SCSIO 12696]
MSPSSNRPLAALPGRKLVVAAVLLAVVVVVLGAFTRLVDAGLGCPDWPGCYGHLLWPDTPEEIRIAEQRFNETVEHDKTWPEMVHRYFATTLGAVIVALTIVAFRARKQYPDYPVKHCIGLLALVILQGAFGAWTVTLKLWPQVVTAHLLGGFSVLALLWLLYLRLGNNAPAAPDRKTDRFRAWAIGGLVVVFIQIALGGWTSSNYAAIACINFPTCHGHWLPPLDMAEAFDITQDIGPNYLGGTMDNDARVTIHFVHRVGALVVTLYLLGLCAALLKAGSASLRPYAIAVLAALVIQVTLGISNVIYIIPLPGAVAHNAGGALLLLTLVTLLHQLYRYRQQPEGTQ